MPVDDRTHAPAGRLPLPTRESLSPVAVPRGVAVPVLIDVLTYLHVLSAIGWLGGALLFLLVIGPLLPRFAPATRRELILSLLPRLASYLTMFGFATIVFGFALAGAVIYDGLDTFDPSQTWGLALTIGILLALLAALEGGLLTRRRLLRLVAMSRDAPTRPDAVPNPEMLVLMGRIRQGAVVTVALLLTALGTMVAAAGA